MKRISRNSSNKDFILFSHFLVFYFIQYQSNFLIDISERMQGILGGRGRRRGTRGRRKGEKEGGEGGEGGGVRGAEIRQEGRERQRQRERGGDMEEIDSPPSRIYTCTSTYIMRTGYSSIIRKKRNPEKKIRAKKG